jgi:hypothetical protein
MPVSMFETEVAQYQTLFHPYQKLHQKSHHHEISAFMLLKLLLCTAFSLIKNTIAE